MFPNTKVLLYGIEWVGVYAVGFLPTTKLLAKYLSSQNGSVVPRGSGLILIFTEDSAEVCTARKFYRRRNNSKVDSIETGRIVIAYLLP